MSADVWYLDSSAIVKVVIEEPESAALRTWLAARPTRASCALARVEVARAVRSNDPDRVARAREAVERLTLLSLDDEVYRAAADIDPPSLRSLDALHLAAALTLGDDLAGVVTYDGRLADGARALGLTVEAPS